MSFQAHARSWPRGSGGTNDAEAGRMLDSQVRLGNASASTSFSRNCPPKAITPRPTMERSCGPLPLPPRARRSCWSASSDATPRPIATCGDAAAAFVAATDGRDAFDLGRIGAALIDDAGPTRRAGGGRPFGAAYVGAARLRRRSSVRPRAGRRGARRACDRAPAALADTYGPDDVLTPAARARQAAEKEVQAARRPGSGASLDHLRRADRPAAGGATGDWDEGQPTQVHMRRLPCAGAFLVAPDQQHWRLKAAQDRRSHVEHNVRSAACDLDLTPKTRQPPHACRRQARGQLPAPAQSSAVRVSSMYRRWADELRRARSETDCE